MAARYRLEIQKAVTNFVFDVEGEYLPYLEPIHKAGSDPLEIIGMRTVWEFRNCRVVSSDGTTPTAWSEWLAFVALWESRGAGTTYPTYARLVAGPNFTDPDDVLWTLGPTGNYEQFQLEAIQGEPDPQAPDASFNTLVNCTIRVSAVKRFADANGIVGFDQAVKTSYPRGQKRIEWTTTFTTAEGTSAVTKAQTYGGIDITAYPMATYTEESNGPDGIEYLAEDADEVNSRVPTVCTCRSVIQEWGVVVGAAGGGTAPSEIGYSYSVQTTAKEVITTTEASAVGPNGDVFVASKAPAGWTDRVVFTDPTTNTYRTTWVSKAPQETPDNAPERTRRLTITLSGGKAVSRWRPIANGLRPIRSQGGIIPAQCVVDVTVFRTGGAGRLDELPFPGILPEPWILDYAESTETEPVLAEAAADPAEDKWERTARVVYKADVLPLTSVLAQLDTLETVESYLVGTD